MSILSIWTDFKQQVISNEILIAALMINYILIGDRHKPVILFLHGFMGSWQDFQDVANLLQDNFCCLLIDLPGHGKTEVSCDLYC